MEGREIACPSPSPINTCPVLVLLHKGAKEIASDAFFNNLPYRELPGLPICRTASREKALVNTEQAWAYCLVSDKPLKSQTIVRSWKECWGRWYIWRSQQRTVPSRDQDLRVKFNSCTRSSPKQSGKRSSNYVSGSRNRKLWMPQAHNCIYLRQTPSFNSRKLELRSRSRTA